MVTLEGIQDGIVGAYSEMSGVIRENPTAAIGGAVIGSAIIGTAIGGVIAAKKKTTKTTRKKHRKITHTKRGWAQDRKRRSKQKWEVAYQKRKKKSKSRKGVHYTKNGQPYILLKNGKARFIKGKRKR